MSVQPHLMPRLPKAKEDRWIPSACAMCYNHCSIKGRVVDGKLVKIEGNPDSVIGNGRLCPKGVSGIMTVYDPNRVSTPLMRTNPKKGRGEDPGFKPISWDQAMDIICEKLKKIRDDDPRKFFFQGTTTSPYVCLYSGFAFTYAFGSPNMLPAAGGLHCGNSSHPTAGVFHASWSSTPDYEFTNYCIYFGCSKGHSAGHVGNAGAQLAAEARRRGMKLVVVDPVNNFAAAKAVEWVPILPGTDAALGLSMMNVMVNELGMFDEEYIKLKSNGPYLIGPDGHYVRDQETNKPLVWDAEAGKAKPFNDSTIGDFALRGKYKVNGVDCRPSFDLFVDRLKEYSPEYASRITSVPVATIRRLATEFAENARIGSTIKLDGHTLPYRPVAAVYFRGVQGHKNGYYNCCTMALLNQIVGAADRVGGSLGFNPVCYGHPDSGGPYYTPTASEDGLMITGQWLKPTKPYPPRMPKKEIQTMGLHEIFPLAGHSIVKVCEEQEELWQKAGLPYRPELVMNYGANSVLAVGHPDTVMETLTRIPFFVSFDVFITETSELADIVLPDVLYLERLEVRPNHPFIFNHPAGRGKWSWPIRQPVVKPPGECRDIQQVLLDIAERVGFLPEYNEYQSLMLGLNKYRLEPDKKYSHEEISDRMLKENFGEDRGLAWFKEHGVISWPKKIEEVYWRDFIDVRVPLYQEFLIDVKEQVKEIADSKGIYLDWENYFDPIVKYNAFDRIEDKDDGYDMYGFYFRHVLHTNSFTMENAWLDEVSQRTPGAYDAVMHPETAKKKGIKDGDWVWLENRRGRRTKARIRLREGIHKQCVASAACAGHWTKYQPTAKGKGVHFNELITVSVDHASPITNSLELTVPIKIYKA